MTTAAVGVPTSRPARQFLESLLAAVRTEFRGELVSRDTADPVLGQGVCAVPGCAIPALHTSLCRSHSHRWRGEGRPDFQTFVATTPAATVAAAIHPGGQRLVPIDFRPLSGSLRLEWQYVLQCRVDEGRARIDATYFNHLVAFVGGSSATSTLDQPAEDWIAQFYAQTGWTKRAIVNAYLTAAWRCLEDLADPPSWDSECVRDVWQLRRLGYPTAWAVLRFDAIEHRWLRDLAKRCLKYRLTTGTAVVTAHVDVQALKGLSASLTAVHGAATGPADLDRAVIEHWFTDCRRSGSWKAATNLISSAATFLRLVRRFQWAPGLAGTADIYPEDYPKTPQYAPRYLSDVVMAQVERPENLAKLPDDQTRLITLIMIRTGIRLTGVLSLELDCLAYDGAAPYLRYFNGKMKREAYVPIGPETAQLIIAQQQVAADRFPGRRPGLFPGSRQNLDGSHHLSDTNYRKKLYQWLQDVDIRDDVGRPVKMTPHQWRHTFATRLTDQNCPQEVIQRLLDHSSPQMTAHYAHLKDKKIRAEWEKATKVNCDGDVVTLDPEHPLNDAIWMNSRVGRATMALPNGYCGLPLTQACEAANQCLTCPMFLTTKDFLGEHRKQRSATARLIAVAENNGQFRMVQTNTAVLHKLDRIITQLDDGSSRCWPTTATT